MNADRRQKNCKACDDEFVFLPIEFLDFMDMDEKERAEYIASLHLTDE